MISVIKTRFFEKAEYILKMSRYWRFTAVHKEVRTLKKQLLITILKLLITTKSVILIDYVKSAKLHLRVLHQLKTLHIFCLLIWIYLLFVVICNRIFYICQEKRSLNVFSVDLQYVIFPPLEHWIRDNHLTGKEEVSGERDEFLQKDIHDIIEKAFKQRGNIKENGY